MKKLLAACLLTMTLPALAQSSASYKLEEHVFNNGGRPENGTVATSSSFKITLDAIGDAIGAQALSSASFNMAGGIVGSNPPPGEVTGFRFDDKQAFHWDPEPSVGVYNLYRDQLSVIGALGYGSCLVQGLPQPSGTDSDPLPGSGGFFYLVTAENRLAEEGTKGFTAEGAERLGTICP